MNPDSLMLAARILAVLAVLLMIFQVVWSHYRQRRLLRDQVRMRLDNGPAPITEGGARVTVSRLESVLLRADIHLSRAQLVIAGLVLTIFIVSVGVIDNTLAALVIAAVIAGALWLYWRIRLQRQRRLIYEELPSIIDSTLRYISAGRSLESSLVEAFKDAPPVFDPLTFRLRSAVEAGRDYTELFEDFARLYAVPALVVVAIALRTSSRFGSSVRPVLRQVAAALRSQQELRREFLAATAEIRFTAVAFALLPMGLAAYMVLANKKYSEILLNTSTGHLMLIVAGSLQAVGVIVMMRLIQGVGRE